MTGMRHARLLLLVAFATMGLLSGCASVTPSVTPVASPATPVHTFGDGPVVAFYGDSYTLGTGASDPGKRWSSVICGERHWNEVNPSTNGLGFVNNRSLQSVDELDTVIGARPDIVLVTMGLNDNFSMPDHAADIQRAIRSDFTRLKTELPSARIIVVEPFWYTDERPASLAEIIGWVKAEAKRIDADYLPGASHWIEHHPEWMAADGLHPNDAGYAAMAKRMDAALAGIGL